MSDPTTTDHLELRTARERAGLSLGDAARRLGVTREVLFNVESGILLDPDVAHVELMGKMEELYGGES